MDEAVTSTGTARVLLRAMLGMLLCAGAGTCAQAQALQDPTRPATGAGTATMAAPGASSGPQLQTILVARDAGGRHLAVIDGQTVRPGDTFQGARVARIGDNEVTLVRGAERQVLRLYAQDAAGMTPARAGNTPQRRAQ
jgi:MSHA biogenesis protein MshK